MINEIKNTAIQHQIPIMSDDSIAFISSVIKETNSRSMLEIGTAVAYSSLSLALDNPMLLIDTLERDEKRYQMAKGHVEQLGMAFRVHCLHEDALRYHNSTIYDCLLIDAAKAQNEQLFRLYFPYTNHVAIIDNIDFHGYTGQSRSIRSRSLRHMIKRLEQFIQYIESRDDLQYQKYDIGDGIMVVRRTGISEINEF